MQPEYHPGLATLELIVEVKRLLATERQTERLICRYLADLADRVREGLAHALWGYGDELHAARCIFGLGVRETRERVRVGRALRELTRVAKPGTETEWLELARTLDMRALERRVAAARGSPASEVSETTQQASPTAAATMSDADALAARVSGCSSSSRRAPPRCAAARARCTSRPKVASSSAGAHYRRPCAAR